MELTVSWYAFLAWLHLSRFWQPSSKAEHHLPEPYTRMPSPLDDE